MGNVINMIGGGKPTQEKTVTPTAAGLTVTQDSGKLLSQVTVAGDSDLVAGNIKKGVNVFGVNGSFDNSEGLYAWKRSDFEYVEKSNTTAQPIFFTKEATNQTINFYCADSYTFDANTGLFTLVNPTMASVVYGSSASLEDAGYVMPFSPSGNIMVQPFSRPSSRGNIWNTSAGVYITVSNSSYTHTSYTSAINMVDPENYIVSDNENAYPNGAVHSDGYYYEKVGEGPDVSSVGFTKGETIEVDCASQTTFTVPHSLGVIPKLILLVGDGGISYNRVSMLVATRYKNGSSYYYMNKYGITNDGITITDVFDTYYIESSSSARITATDTTITFNYDNSNNGYFSRGSKYKCLVLG